MEAIFYKVNSTLKVFFLNEGYELFSLHFLLLIF